MSDFEYDGLIYVRPIGRGVVLVDLDSISVDDAIENAIRARYGDGSSWHGHARITVELGEPVADSWGAPASGEPDGAPAR